MVPDSNLDTVLEASETQIDLDEESLITRAILNPINSSPISGIFGKGDRVVIVTSDITRPMPSYKVLPRLVNELNTSGITDEDITVVFGLGSHRSHTEDEKKILSEMKFTAGLNASTAILKM